MRVYSALVYDGFVPNGTPVMSGDQWCDLLGSANRIALHAVVDRATGGSPILNVQLVFSTNGRAFEPWGTQPQIKDKALDTGGTVSVFGSDSGSTPFGALGRVQITLSGTNPAAFVKIYACGRDRSRRGVAASTRSEWTMPVQGRGPVPMLMPSVVGIPTATATGGGLSVAGTVPTLVNPGMSGPLTSGWGASSTATRGLTRRPGGA